MVSFFSFSIMGHIGGKNTMFSRETSQSGFTLLEIILVLHIIAIGSAIVIGRAVHTSNADVISQAEVIKSHLRYAQSRAMNTTVVWGIRSFHGHYWLFRDGSETHKVVFPGEDTDTVDLTAKGISMDAFRLSFDSWGVPYKGSSASPDKKLKPGDSESRIKVSSGGAHTYIRLTPNTGYIP